MKTVSIDMFFDPQRVVRPAEAAHRKQLIQAGAFVRTAARSSIRSRRRVSAAGQPPSSHTGLLKRFIFFGSDPARQSVIVGPMALNSKGGSGPETLSALEHGGSSTYVEGIRQRRRKKRIRVAARPFMGPALAQEAPKFPGLWKNSVR